MATSVQPQHELRDANGAVLSPCTYNRCLQGCRKPSAHPWKDDLAVLASILSWETAIPHNSSVCLECKLVWLQRSKAGRVDDTDLSVLDYRIEKVRDQIAERDLTSPLNLRRGVILQGNP